MSHLQTYGRRLIAAGYNIIPLKPGEKRPTLKNWTQLDASREIDQWLDGPMRNWGVGIQSRHNPAIDIDCEDIEIVRALAVEIARITGSRPVHRVGRAPRALLIFRTDEPFPKIRSAKYEDPKLSTSHQVEILGDGQQFAAYHVHPSTGKDYAWPNGGPAGVESDALPTLTQEQAIAVVAAFEALAGKKVAAGEWVPAGSQATAVALPHAENFLLTHRTAKPVADAEIAAALDVLSAADYDRWLQVGMALHHQFNGDERGYELWDTWSQSNGGDYSGPEDTHYRWNGFRSDTKASTVTIASLFHWAQEARQEQADGALGEIEKCIAGCDSFSDLLGGRTARVCRDWLDLYPLFRDRVVHLVRQRARVLSGSPVSVETVRRALKSTKAPVASESLEMFPWAEPFVYLSEDNAFFNVQSRLSCNREAFNAEFNRLVPGEDARDRAATAALDTVKIPVVRGQRYLPGAETLFNLDGILYANRYDPESGAVVPETLSKADCRAREMFARHVQTLIPDANDRRVFIDYLTYVVQNPGKKVNFAILLQGQEGDGKSFFAEMMGLILGPQNCRSIGGENMEDKFTSWAEGSQLCFVEEVKLHGVSGYETLNKFKTYITNKTVVVRRMRTDPYTTPNVTSYVLLTNFRNALPLDDTDTRYYVIFSRWDSAAQLAEWKAANPTFFDDLYDSMRAAPGSLRKWFLERDISPDFKAEGRAPMSESKKEMASLSRNDNVVHLNDIIESQGRGEYGKNTELLSTSWLLDNWGFDGSQLKKPETRSLATLMLREGWYRVQFVTADGTETDRISVNHRNHRFWSKQVRPERVRLNSVEVQLRLHGTYAKTLD